MGCGMSRSNLMDEGMAAFGARLTLHHKPKNGPPNFSLNNTSQASILHEPPVLQKINTGEVNHSDHDNLDGEQMWFGSPSFREYVQSVPDGEETRTAIHGGEKLTCHRQVYAWEDFKGKEHEDKKDTIGGKFRKVFHVQRATFLHGHAGDTKAIRKAV